MINMIWAQSLNGVIGDQAGDSPTNIPWRIPSDLKFFKDMTMGGLVIMGRTTFDSLPVYASSPHTPLPGRTVCVLTKNNRDVIEDENAEAIKNGSLVVFDNIHNLRNAAIEVSALHNDVWIAGGRKLYKQFLHLADQIIITEFDFVVNGTTDILDVLGSVFNPDTTAALQLTTSPWKDLPKSDARDPHCTHPDATFRQHVLIRKGFTRND